MNYKEKVAKQFSKRALTFDESASWVLDPQLIEGHLPKSHLPPGLVLELCCGTGAVGKCFKDHGYDVIGLDISEEMVQIAGQNFEVHRHDVEDKLPFENSKFDVVVLRQALFMLDVPLIFKEIKRVLKNKGCFILSQTVPFSRLDHDWLKKIHETKQAALRYFARADDLEKMAEASGFQVADRKYLRVRESINNWMRNAPELTEEKRQEVISLVRNAPKEYKETRNVQVIKEEVFEDWSWVIFFLHKSIENSVQNQSVE